MKAGRELDALVAEKVMGWTWEKIEGRDFLIPPGSLVTITEEYNKTIGYREVKIHTPCFSEDIAAAWEVVEKLQSMNWAFILDNMEGCLGHWQAHFEKDRANIRTADSDIAPHAICLAALKAIGFDR